MITFIVLLSIIMAALTTFILLAGITSGTIILVFSDLIVFVMIIVAIIKLIRK